jgi:hypothetical protein
MRRSLVFLVALFMVGACGGAPSVAAPVVTASSIAVKSSDLPNGMTKCDSSGDINTFLNAIKAKDPTTYDTTKKEWDAATKAGATAAEVALFTDTVDHCSGVTSNQSSFGTANYKVVINFVIQFKDEATAAKGYTTESIFGFSAATLKGGGLPTVEGKDTGFGPNSILLTFGTSTISFYIAVWQKKSFMVEFAALNLDTATSKKIALAVNGRIH